MNRWLVKSEPSTYSYADLVRERRTAWEGVTNNTAQMHLRAMRRGDEVLFYHSGKERAVVGLSRVAADPVADPADPTAKRVLVELVPVRALKEPIRLETLRAAAVFADWDLLRISRLSVVPVAPGHWQVLETLGL